MSLWDTAEKLLSGFTQDNFWCMVKSSCKMKFHMTFIWSWLLAWESSLIGDRFQGNESFRGSYCCKCCNNQFCDACKDLHLPNDIHWVRAEQFCSAVFPSTSSLPLSLQHKEQKFSSHPRSPNYVLFSRALMEKKYRLLFSCEKIKMRISISD